jgi:hypothetical protein
MKFSSSLILNAENRGAGFSERCNLIDVKATTWRRRMRMVLRD